MDRHGSISFVNPAGARMLGRSSEELIGKLQHKILHAADYGPPLPWEASLIHAVLQDGQTRFVEDRLFAHSDGSPIPVRFSCAAIRESDGIIGAVVTYRDISELKQAEERLRRSEEQLRQAQKMEVLGQLAGGIAHDFNNLLSIIMGYTAMVTDSVLTPEHPAQKLIGEVMKAAERAAALTGQLLAFSRKQALSLQEVALNSVVDELGKMLHRLIGEDVKLDTVLAPDLGKVLADPGQIAQVILNLAVNARDAMPRGGCLTIETANVLLDAAYAGTHPEVRPGPYVMLAVTDTGCGMDPATQGRIFEPFFTTKGPGKGTGLGLATVYGIVKQSGGSIFVYSEVGRGSCFKAYLPCIEGAAPVPRRRGVRGSRPVGRETLLVAEDDPALRSLLLKTLRNSNYDVLEAVDGLDALRQAEQHSGPIQLLVTDVVMPGMNGRELAERLMALRPDLKVLYASGYTDETVVRHGLLEAEVDFLQKPFTLDNLARKVRAVLDQTGFDRSGQSFPRGSPVIAGT